MDEQKARDILSGRAAGAGAGGLRAALWVASKPYAAGMRVRRWAYRRGIFRSCAADVPVICVGNLTTGGTGKTPMVAWIVARLKQAGRRPAILTRGYKPSPQDSPPQGLPASAEQVRRTPQHPSNRSSQSDEATLLARLTDMPVVVDADRAAGAARAVADGADVLVMDDGFQHLRLRRDLDVVLIDAAEPFGFGHCLPRGLLREPPAALGDADAVVLTHADEVAPDRLAALDERLARLAPRASRHAAVHEPTALIDETATARAPADLSGRKVYAFCGLAGPEHFFATLSRLGARVTATRSLDDHAAYTPALLADLADEARRSGAEALITTQKDYVKLAGMALPAAVWQLAVGMTVTAGREELVRRILAAAGSADAP